MLQPDSLHSNPAFLKILSSPSCSACFFTSCDPGTTIARTLDEILFPLITLDASIKSSNLEFVQEPMKIRSSVISMICVPGLRPMYCNALSAAFSSSGFPFEYSSGNGTVPVTSVVMAGFVPHDTCGDILSACNVKLLSKYAPVSLFRFSRQ